MFDMNGRGCGQRDGADWQRDFHTIRDQIREAVHGAHRHHGRGGGCGGGRSRRMFDGGELKLLLLKLIADAPRQGYDMIREIEAMTGGAYAPSPGVVYPKLTLLDEMNLIGEQQ